MNILLKTLTFTTKTVIFAVNNDHCFVDKTFKTTFPNPNHFFFQPIHSAYYYYSFLFFSK
jgi:type I site-specific restriction endonuclease